MFPNLRTCLFSLDRRDSASVITDSIHSSIEHLQIQYNHGSTHALTSRLLCNTPRLRRLNVHFSYSSEDMMPSLAHSPSRSTMSMLTHLTLMSDCLGFSSIEWLLTFMPHRRTLHGQMRSKCARMGTIGNWERLLAIERMPMLKRLDMKLNVNVSLSNSVIIGDINQEFWRSSKTSFYISFRKCRVCLTKLKRISIDEAIYIHISIA